ncbi:hypothetical protein HON71_05535 [Candidatus Woesearchaeota archaeon]|jgi:hypothetical protein|nr:hypothetical protein [Candidatus Woesearchaeota archaeon]
MTKKAVLGVENEFLLIGKDRKISDHYTLNDYFRQFAQRLQGEHFQRGNSALRLSTGGAFYIDGDAPEVTSAPFFVQPGSAEATAHNLFANINLVTEAINSYNTNVYQHEQVHLQGHSGHFNFTFPHTEQKTAEIAHLLTKTVNPALRLFIQNRDSKGGMYRYRPQGRVEVCGEYIPGVENVTSALAFQLIMFQKIDEMLKLGASMRDIEEQFRYTLPGQINPAKSRSGYALPTPEINKHGRDAKLNLVDRNGRNITMRAQGLLEHYFQLFEPYVDQVLSEDERILLMEHVSGERLLHIDSKGSPIGYKHVHTTEVDQEKAMSGLGGAFGRAAKEYKVGKHELKPRAVDWDSIGFQYKNGDEDNKVVTFNVPQTQLVAFDKIVREHPELLASLAKREFSAQELALFKSYGITDPSALITPPSRPIGDSVYNFGLSDELLSNLNLNNRFEVPRDEIPYGDGRSLYDILSGSVIPPSNEIYRINREPISEIYQLNRESANNEIIRYNNHNNLDSLINNNIILNERNLNNLNNMYNIFEPIDYLSSINERPNREPREERSTNSLESLILGEGRDERNHRLINEIYLSPDLRDDSNESCTSEPEENNDPSNDIDDSDEAKD